MLYDESGLKVLSENAPSERKVMVATMPLYDNHGGILQCYALCEVLESLGYVPVVLDRKIHYSFWKKIIVFFLSRLPGQNIKKFRHRHLRAKAQRAFVRDFIPATMPLSGKKDVVNAYKLYRPGSVVVGSDQVWRFSYINQPFWDFYFLSFVDNSKKLSYAASFGLDHWEKPGLIEDIKKHLSSFSGISVRETSGSIICQETFGYTAKVNIDPTMLIDGEMYKDNFRLEPGDELSLVTYILDSNPKKEECVNRVYLEGGFSKKMSLNDPILSRGLSARKWVESIASAKLVVTDSFHGMVFSIIMRKNFVAFVNEGRGADRFSSLCAYLGLEKKLIFSERDFSNSVNAAIDYDDVHDRLGKLRKASIEYLESTLAYS
ncbi:polysaccharide pyruvyl transferase family protein [Alcanivorax sp. ZXX171]|nr:polysaccharide pyruvyl transferase family protein [Alcanivorax sp. ZXX171]